MGAVFCKVKDSSLNILACLFYWFFFIYNRLKVKFYISVLAIIKAVGRCGTVCLGFCNCFILLKERAHVSDSVFVWFSLFKSVLMVKV